MHLPDKASYRKKKKNYSKPTCIHTTLTTVLLMLGKTQVRFSHTDVPMPDFGAYRREVSQDPNKPNTSEVSRRAFTYLMVAGMGVTGLHAGKNVVLDFISTMSASADVLALAKIEVDLTTIPEGKICRCL